MTIELQHIYSKERKVVVCDGWNRKRGLFDVYWSVAGTFQFSSTTGLGREQANLWRIDVGSLRKLRNDPDYTPPSPEFGRMEAR